MMGPTRTLVEELKKKKNDSKFVQLNYTHDKKEVVEDVEQNTKLEEIIKEKKEAIDNINKLDNLIIIQCKKSWYEYLWSFIY